MNSNEGDQPDDQKKDVGNAEVQAAVEKLLGEISNTFSGISSDIFSKLDEMSRRLDRLEASVKAEKPKEDPSSSA